MPVRPIVKFPDPLLSRPAAEVEAFDDDLGALAADLLDTMRAAPGIGITGPHIGVLQRVVVIETSFADGARTFVNPVITWSSPETAPHQEGSVSMPGVSDEIERPTRIKLRWQDLDGLTHTGEADGLLAVCLQHEIDQLDGCFWIDRLSRLKRERIVKKYEKLQKR